MNPEKIVLDGMVITISQDKGRVFVNLQKGVFSFLETMTAEQADQVGEVLRWAAVTAYTCRKVGA